MSFERADQDMAIETLIKRIAPHLLPTLSAFFVAAYNSFNFGGSNTKSFENFINYQLQFIHPFWYEINNGNGV